MANDHTDASFFRGDALYGDSFSGPELDRWFAEEAEGYADLGAKDAEAYVYGYYALNWYHGFRHLPDHPFRAILGFGSAYGHELEPIAHRAASITITDPSDAFAHTDLHGTPLTFVKPVASGALPFQSNVFDLVTCLGVLHHIPNVSYVLSEIARVMAPGGYCLLREPITSMGDWRKRRRGLTKNERGIPIGLLRQMIGRAGLHVMREAPCITRVMQVGALRIGVNPYNSMLVTRLDAWFSRVAGFRRPYHATRLRHRVLPMCVYYVLRKRDNEWCPSCN
jgi:SAM-dependent methyltransferase